jgi:uncharacterized protein (DUF1330 family)
MLVALDVRDPERYQRYREEMGPILESYGGGFGYDFEVSAVLRSRTPGPYNRVFTIYFADAEHRELFFGDPRYQEVKRRWFEDAAANATVIASWER